MWAPRGQWRKARQPPPRPLCVTERGHPPVPHPRGRSKKAAAGQLDESTGYFVVHDVLRARIARAEIELDRRVSEAVEHGERTGIHSLSALQSHMSQPDAAAAAEPAAGAPQPAPTVDFDPEVAAIFCEEASELLESSQLALQAWNAAPSDSEYPAALNRALHTFKGGARMAGVTALGDLAHELESLIINIGLGTAEGDERARVVAQEAIDELARMREQVASGRAAAPATALIARLQAAARGEVLAPAAIAAPPAAAPVLKPAPARTPVPTPVSTFAPVPIPQRVAAAPAAVSPPVTLSAPAPASMPTRAAAAAPSRAPEALGAALPVPPGREPGAGAERGGMAGSSAELLNQLLN